MGDKSAIEWTDSSWNPIRARNLATDKVGWFCEHVSEACANCYAEKRNVNTFFGNGLAYKPGHRKDVEIFLDERMLTVPLRWKRPRKIFPCSMTDLFADFVPDEFLDKMFAVMALSRHTFQVLTKRPERMARYVPKWFERVAMSNATIRHPTGETKLADLFDWSTLPTILPNVWLGITAEDQDELDRRWPHLAACPATKRFISYEPALDQIGILKLRPSPDWIICGGESGGKARPMRTEWVLSLIKQCRSLKVPLFVKQMGRKIIDRNDAGFDGCDDRAWDIADEGTIENDIHGYLEEYQGADCLVTLSDKKGADMNEWPKLLRIRQFPEHSIPHSHFRRRGLSPRGPSNFGDGQ